ncbi:hypothetical protein L1856_22105 [Streptomyces sp. Tue 6430]|nr:hypothetical protein [Streptomyces sp. Tue 6430]
MAAVTPAHGTNDLDAGGRIRTPLDAKSTRSAGATVVAAPLLYGNHRRSLRTRDADPTAT